MYIDYPDLLRLENKMNRLFLIDSNPTEGAVLKHLLSNRADIDFIGQAYNGKQGIKMIKELKPQIVFLEISKNTKRNNLKLIPLIKSISDDIFIVAISMYYEFIMIQTAFNYGAYTYLMKPMNIEELFLLLNKFSHKIKSNSIETCSFDQLNPYIKYEFIIEKIKYSPSEEIDKTINEIYYDVFNSSENTIEHLIKQCKILANLLLEHSDDKNNDQSNHHDVLVILTNSFKSKLNHLYSKSEIFKHLSNFINDCNHIFNNEVHNLGIERITRAKTLVKQWIETEKNVTLEIIAQEMYLSPYYLSRMFKKIEGVTFIDYVLNCRIEKAKVQLLTTNETIELIAIGCGYNEPNSFRRMFRKKTGVSPSEYRLTRI